MTQKYHRVEKQSKKPSQMHKHPASPAGTPKCTSTSTQQAQARAWLSYRGRVPGRVVARGRPCRRPVWPYCSYSAAHPARIRPRPSAQRPERQRLLAQHARSLSLLRAQRRIVAAQPAISQGPAPCRSAPLAVSWAGTRARPAPSLPNSTIQHFCIAAPKTSLTKPLSHDTNFVS